MTLAEAEKRYALPESVLLDYIACGFIRKTGDDVYADEDFRNLGLLHTLKNSRLSSADIKRYLALSNQTDGKMGMIRMLRKQRRILLNEIHEKQELLDQLDALIQQTNR